MVVFIVCIAALLYLALALSSILKWRTKAEEEEFTIRREFLVLSGFAEGIVSYIPSEAIKDRREAVLASRSIQMMAEKGQVLSTSLENVSNKMYPEDATKWEELKRATEECVIKYNKAVTTFNKKINNPFIFWFSKRLKVKPMKEIE